MESITLQRLLDSISDVADIRLECLKTNPNISLVLERTLRLDEHLCFVFDEVQDAGTQRTVRDAKKEADPSVTLKTMRERFNSLPGADRDALLERARQTLPPRSHNDADAVLIAAFDMFCAESERVL